MIPSSDPRLTAYALGEMDEAQKQAFEAELLKSEDARRELAELSAAAELLEAELGKKAPPELASAQKDKIEAEAAKPPPAKKQEKKEEGALPAGGSVTALRSSFATRAALILTPLALAAGVAFVLFTGREMSKEAADYAEGKGAASASPLSKATAYAATTATAYGSAAYNRDDKLKLEPSGNVEIPSTAPLPENPFVDTAKDPKSTFGVDVDTASYSIVRKLLESGQMPQPGNVRVEEMVNYFKYAYPPPDDAAFGVMADATEAPWATGHRLVRIGIKGKTVQMQKRPGSNLVFLIDTSGSMEGPDRLDLLKKGFEMLVEQLDQRDTVSIVVYAGSSGLVLSPTHGNEKRKILDALDHLKAGGGTNGGAGIQLAYETAKASFVEGGTNRVILATDGDFNVGTTSQSDLQQLIEEKAKTGVFLSVLGFGTGNTRDATMETLADKGNGNYSYIDSANEAKRVLVDQATGTLITIAKDVKIQIAFDPKTVQSFRLIGYENRVMAHEDFDNDKKDAGEIGAGHTVTALYEVVTKAAPAASGTHLADISLRYKDPDGTTSRLVETSVVDKGGAFADASTDFRFAASVAGFGMMLRGSTHKGDLSYGQVATIAKGALGDDSDGYRKEFVKLVEKASRLSDH